MSKKKNHEQKIAKKETSSEEINSEEIASSPDTVKEEKSRARNCWKRNKF